MPLRLVYSFDRTGLLDFLDSSRDLVIDGYLHAGCLERSENNGFDFLRGRVGVGGLEALEYLRLIRGVLLKYLILLWII
jgi:hypothetical protein